MEKLKNLKKMMIGTLEDYAQNGITNSKDLETVDKLAHAAKNLGKVIEMCEEEDGGGSSFRGGSYARGGRGSYEGGSYEGGSYRRRDSMGRYAREGGQGGSSYDSAYAEASEDMRQKLEQMMHKAGSEEERRTIRKLLEQI